MLGLRLTLVFCWWFFLFIHDYLNIFWLYPSSNMAALPIPVILNWVWFCSPANIWKHLETLCLTQLGGGMLLASNGWKLELLRNISQCTGKPGQQRIIWPQMPVVLVLRNPDQCHTNIMQLFIDCVLGGSTVLILWSKLRQLTLCPCPLGVCSVEEKDINSVPGTFPLQLFPACIHIWDNRFCVTFKLLISIDDHVKSHSEFKGLQS